MVDQNWYNTTTQTSTDNFQYGYDEDGDVLYKQNLVDTAMSELYQYDNLHQLISFARGTLNSTDNGIVGTPSASQSWTPDALGNFTSVTTNGATQTRTANQQNEYTSISGSGTITYDANGNITADGSGNTYVYDAWNRLVAVKNGTTTLAAYGYDGLGRRTTETHGSTTTDLYYSSNWQVLEEHINGQLQARYVWSPTGIDTLVLRDDSSQDNGVLDRRLYVQQDANGNVTALLDTNGNVVERYDYDPFGAVTVLNPDFSVRGTSSYNWNYFFQGKPYDGTVGLYDSRGRVYSPALMRPLQADPLGLAPDNNDYCWEGNDPTNEIDPSGLAASQPVTIASIGNRLEEIDKELKQLEADIKALTGGVLPQTVEGVIKSTDPRNHEKVLRLLGRAMQLEEEADTLTTIGLRRLDREEGSLPAGLLWYRRAREIKNRASALTKPIRDFLDECVRQQTLKALGRWQKPGPGINGDNRTPEQRRAAELSALRDEIGELYKKFEDTNDYKYKRQADAKVEEARRRYGRELGILERPDIEPHLPEVPIIEPPPPPPVPIGK